MSSKINSSIPIEKRRFANGAGRLYLQKNSKNWWYEIKFEKKKYRGSTKTPDINAALLHGEDIYRDMYYKAEFGIKASPVIKDLIYELISELISKNHCPTQIQKKWLHRSQNIKIKKPIGDWKVFFKDYIYILYNNMLHLWGDIKIADLKMKDLDNYYSHLCEKIGHAPTSSALGNHISTYNCLKKWAFRNEYIENNTLPHFSKRDYIKKKSIIMDYFTDEEIEKIFSYFPEFINKAHKKRDKNLRSILYDFCNFSLMTGCRPVQDCRYLKWIDIEFKKDKYGMDYLSFHFKGKDHDRIAVGKITIKKYLNNLKNRHDDLKSKTIKELIRNCNQLVFASPDNKIFSSGFRKIFKRLLEDINLRNGKTGSPRVLYTWRTTYATQMALKGISFDLLKLQMGTSSKMLRDHYIKVTTTMKADELNGSDSLYYQAIVMGDGNILINKDILKQQQLTFKPGQGFIIKKDKNNNIVLEPTNHIKPSSNMFDFPIEPLGSQAGL